MASSTKPDLVAVTTPATTDVLSVRQSGDSRDKKETVAQVGVALGAVAGPASATSKALSRFSDTTGKVIQDGLILESDTGMLQLNGTTASFPGLKRNGSDVEVRAADDSAPASMIFGGFYVKDNATVRIRAYGDGSKIRILVSSQTYIRWSSGSAWDSGDDAGLTRAAAGVMSIDGAAAADGLGKLAVGGGRLVGRTSSAAGPTTTEYPSDKDFGVHKNTASGAVSFAYNDGGTIKSALLV